MQECRTCKVVLSESEFYRNGKYLRAECKPCYVERRRRNSSGRCIDCDSVIERRNLRCRYCDSSLRRGSGSFRKNRDGYMVKVIKEAGKPSIWLREHRCIMGEHLGRPLLDTEHVHHINGIRHDNRIENLELWTTSHPAGQRVVDVVSWCEEMLALYRGE